MCTPCEMLNGQQWLFLDSLVNVCTAAEIADGGMSMQTADELFTLECRNGPGIHVTVTAVDRWLECLL